MNLQVSFPAHWFFERQVWAKARPSHHHDRKPSVGSGVSPPLLSSRCYLLRVRRWLQSTSFASYMLSRVIGGVSEGNVQLAM